MAFRRRSTSGSKPQLKEKVVQIYESFFKVSETFNIFTINSFFDLTI